MSQNSAKWCITVDFVMGLHEGWWRVYYWKV